MVSLAPTIWISAILTLFVLSYMYKETIFYRIAEHTVIGCSMGISLVMGLGNIRNIIYIPLTEGKFLAIIPLILGLMLFTRFFSSEIKNLNRIPIAILVGTAMGLGARGMAESYLWKMSMTTIDLAASFTSDISNIIYVIVVVVTLMYFVFMVKHEGPIMGNAGRLGRVFLLMWSGVVYGNIINGRLMVLVSRIQFLLWEWLQIGVGA